MAKHGIPKTKGLRKITAMNLFYLRKTKSDQGNKEWIKYNQQQ